MVANIVKESLQKCDSFDELSYLMDNLQPKIGRFGGRQFVIKEKEGEGYVKWGDLMKKIDSLYMNVVNEEDLEKEKKFFSSGISYLQVISKTINLKGKAEELANKSKIKFYLGKFIEIPTVIKEVFKMVSHISSFGNTFTIMEYTFLPAASILNDLSSEEIDKLLKSYKNNNWEEIRQSTEKPACNFLHRKHIQYFNLVSIAHETNSNIPFTLVKKEFDLKNDFATLKAQSDPIKFELLAYCILRFSKSYAFSDEIMVPFFNGLDWPSQDMKNEFMRNYPPQESSSPKPSTEKFDFEYPSHIRKDASISDLPTKKKIFLQQAKQVIQKYSANAPITKREINEVLEVLENLVLDNKGAKEDLIHRINACLAVKKNWLLKNHPDKVLVNDPNKVEKEEEFKIGNILFNMLSNWKK